MNRMTDPNTVRVTGGDFISFVDPNPADIKIEAIARGLSRAARFGGHTGPYYTVAQHAVMVSHLLEPEYELALAGLHHDDSEAFIADIPTPAKRLLPEYYVLEERLQNAILRSLDLPEGSQHHPRVKQADMAMLFLERDAMIDDSIEWSNEEMHPGYKLKDRFTWWEPWDSDTAMAMYLARHNYLNEKVRNLRLARAAA